MKTILLVEDDPFLADIYKTKFKEFNFKVLIASDGNEALKEIKIKRPDLLLLDIVLPGIDGWEVLKEMKKNNLLKDVPAIIISNLGQKNEVEKGLSLGATKYLIKACYTPTEVVKEVKKVLTSNK